MNPGNPIRVPARQQGLALVMVLWLVVLLSVIAGGHVMNVHTESRLAASHLYMAKSRAAVEAGINLAIHDLFSAGDERFWRLDGTTKEIGIDNRKIRVAIRDVSGFLDLNAGDPALLKALLAALDVEDDRRDRIVAAILDWRDADDATRLNGAEAAEYATAGLDWTPANEPFSSVEELRYVLGMSDTLFDELAPFVTVFSDRTGLNIEFAAPLLIEAVNGRTVELGAGGRPAGTGTAVGTGTYHLYASSKDATGSGASAEAVVRIIENRDMPYAMLAWRDSMRVDFPENPPHDP